MLTDDAKRLDKDHSLTGGAKKQIDSLSKEELIQEINKGNRSRFQRDKFAYLKTRLEAIKNEESEKQRREDTAYKLEGLTLAQEANEISKNANNLSIIAIIVSVVAALLALASLIFKG